MEYRVGDYVRIKGTPTVVRISQVLKHGVPYPYITDADRDELFCAGELEPATEREYLDSPVSIGGDIVRKENILPPRPGTSFNDPFSTGKIEFDYRPEMGQLPPSWETTLKKAVEKASASLRKLQPNQARDRLEVCATLHLPFEGPLSVYLEQAYAKILTIDCTVQSRPGKEWQNDWEIARDSLSDPENIREVMEDLFDEPLVVLAARQTAKFASSEREVLEMIWDSQAQPRIVEHWIGPWGERVGCAQRHWQNIRRTIYDHGFDTERVLDIAAWFKECPVDVDPVEFATMPFCTDLFKYNDWENWLYNNPW